MRKDGKKSGNARGNVIFLRLLFFRLPRELAALALPGITTVSCKYVGVRAALDYNSMRY
jgi:hypothetical protein